MNNQYNFITALLSILYLPVFNKFIAFAWGARDPEWLMVLKRLFVILPVLAIILGYAVSIMSFFTVLVRIKRSEFATAIFITWWDLGRAIFTYWGGIFKFLYMLLLSITGLIKILFVGIWVLILDIILIPFRVMMSFGNNVLNPGLPWIAVFMTLFWCVFESMIFAYVMTPVVMDLMSNMTGSAMSEGFVRLPVFLFMLFIILGSYAVLCSWADTFKKKDIRGILKIGVVEGVAASVEILFLYREFVDAVVPWFAQYSSQEFELGIFWTLFIATTTWIGIRSMSWFLFAAAGTPTLMAIIQGTGLKGKKDVGYVGQDLFKVTVSVIQQLKMELDWAQNKGEALLAAFLLPPLQVIAAMLNFCTLFLTTKHLFDLPIRSLDEIKDAKTLLKKVIPPQPEKPNAGPL